jgi:hypothetical protein
VAPVCGSNELKVKLPIVAVQVTVALAVFGIPNQKMGSSKNSRQV